jgi:tRNA-dihydrouridine synthase
LFGIGWRFRAAANADFAAAIRAEVSIPVITNGGFQDRDTIDSVLAAGKCDMVAIARPLLANPDLLEQFARGMKRPTRPCSFCSLCCSQAAVFPLGCYDQRRFDSVEAMMDQVLAWSSPNAPFSLQGKPLTGVAESPGET